MSVLLSEADAAYLLEIGQRIQHFSGGLEMAARMDRILKDGAIAAHRAFNPFSNDPNADIKKVTVFFSRLDPKTRFDSYMEAKKHHKKLKLRKLVMENVDFWTEDAADKVIQALANYWDINL